MQEFMELRSQISVRHELSHFGGGRESVRGGSLINFPHNTLRRELAEKSLISKSHMSASENGDKTDRSAPSPADMGFFDIARTLMANSDYLMLMFSITGLFFVVAGI
mgnify:CR=1 FL=1